MTRRQQDTRPTHRPQVSVLPYASPTEEVWPWLCQHILYRCEEGRHCHRSLLQAQVFTPSHEPKANPPGRPQAGQEPTRQGTRDPGRVLVGGREGKLPTVLVGYTGFPVIAGFAFSSLQLSRPVRLPVVSPGPRCWCYGCFSPTTHAEFETRTSSPDARVIHFKARRNRCALCGGEVRGWELGDSLPFLYLQSAEDLMTDWSMFSMTCEKQFVPKDEKFLYCSEG